jgi:hypothetical protein
MFIVVSRQEIEKRLRNAGFSKAEIATIMNTELFFKDVSAFFRGHYKYHPKQQYEANQYQAV